MGIGFFLGGAAQGLTAGINAGNSIMDRKRQGKRDAESDQRYQDGLKHRTAQETKAESRYQDGLTYRDSRNKVTDTRNATIDARNEKTAGLQQQVASNKLNAYQLAKETKTVENYILAASKDDFGTVLKSTGRGKKLMEQYHLDNMDIQGVDNADGSRGYHILGKRKGEDWSLLGANGQSLQGDEQASPLSQAGLVAFTSHILGVSQEAVDTAFGNQQRVKLARMNENAKADKVQAGKVEIANIKANKGASAKPATSSEMRQLRKELTNNESLSSLISESLNGESLPDNVMPYVKNQMDVLRKQGISSEDIRSTILKTLSSPENMVFKGGLLNDKVIFNPNAHANKVDTSLFTQANIEHTAKVNHMTVTQVKAKLGIQ